jgi:hypothetical protein
MPKRKNSTPVLEAEAFVHWVDAVNRELAALVEGVPVTIHVPPDCAIILRGERVKFRMVQPRDRLRVACTKLADSLVARAIEVQPSYPAPSLSQ